MQATLDSHPDTAAVPRGAATLDRPQRMRETGLHPRIALVASGAAALAAALVASAALVAPAAPLVAPAPLPGAQARLVEPAGPSPLHAAAARRTVSWTGGPMTASTGEQVTVFVSTRYTAEQHNPQGWADFIASLPHGAELASVTAYIAPLDELQEICGTQALGCYGGGQLYSSGDVYKTVTPQEIVRHEFGHHIAANRSNPPWRAIDWGPKAWASDQGICTRTADLTAYPGDEGDHYDLNPGEAWAESYRVFAEQRAGVPPSPWEIVDPSFQPDPEALVAIEKDVLQPWTASTTRVYRRKLTLETPKVWSIPLQTPLDGDIAITVSLPKGGYHRVTLLGQDGTTVVARGLWSGTTTQRVSMTLCGQRSLTLRITRRGSVGRVTAVVSFP